MDLRGLLAGPETLMSVGSGMLAQPLSGLAGLLALPAGPERAANVVRNTQERLTYQPQTEGGQKIMGLLAPVGEFWQGLQQKTGGAGYAVGGPLGGAVGAMVPDAAAMLPVGALFRGMRGAPQRFPLPNQSQAGAIVYHATPNKFAPTKTNRFGEFDATKIGTGEGAQAYGYGHYAADAKDTARNYLNAGRYVNGSGSRVDFFIGDKLYTPENAIRGGEKQILERMGLPDKKSIASDIRDSRTNLVAEAGGKRFFSRQQQMEYDELSDALNMMRKFKYTPEPNLYTVDLADSAIPQMLNYDVALTQQPHAMNALENLAPMLEVDRAALMGADASKMTGAGLLQYAAKAHGGDEVAAAQYLRSQGIPGVRYLDGFSRNAGSGTSNYVVFPGGESLLKILNRE